MNFSTEIESQLIHLKDERFFVLQLPIFWKSLIWISVTGSWIVGSLSKNALYSHIRGTKVQDQPINVLILIEQIVHHICSSLTTLSLSLGILLGISPSQFAHFVSNRIISENFFCSIFSNVAIFGTVFLGINGLGLATFRILYLLKGKWLKYRVGEKCLLGMIECLVFTISLFLVFLCQIESDRNRSLVNMCFGRSSTMQVRPYCCVTPFGTFNNYS